MNRTELDGTISELETLRHTPAGIALLRFRIRHESDLVEAGALRRVTLDLAAVALGEPAAYLAGLDTGTRVSVVGFLAPQRLGSDRLVLHIQDVVHTS